MLAYSMLYAVAVGVPADLERAQITADDVVGVQQDDAGVQSVRVHRLSRSPAP